MSDCVSFQYGGCPGKPTCTRPCHIPTINLDERQTAFNLSTSLSILTVSAVIALVFIGAVAMQGRENWREYNIAQERV